LLPALFLALGFPAAAFPFLAGALRFAGFAEAFFLAGDRFPDGFLVAAFLRVCFLAIRSNLDDLQEIQNGDR
jgi:hypothetical protein